MDSKINIVVKTAAGKQYKLEVAASATVAEVKKQLEPQCEIPADLQRLIYSGHVTDDSKTLESYGTSLCLLLLSVWYCLPCNLPCFISHS